MVQLWIRLIQAKVKNIDQCPLVLKDQVLSGLGTLGLDGYGEIIQQEHSEVEGLNETT